MTDSRYTLIAIFLTAVLSGPALWAISHHITTVPQTEVVAGEGCNG